VQDVLVKGEVSRRKVYIVENLCREDLRKLKAADKHWCSVLERPFSTEVCLARVFLKGHSNHKACTKCSKFDDYMGILIKEIRGHETPG